MPLTNYADEALVKLLFGATTLTPPETWYVALFTTAPTQSSAGTEVSGGAYARQAVTNSSTYWEVVESEPSDGYSMQNADVITYTEATASWGTVLAAGLFDALTDGNLWGYGTFTGVAIGSGITASFAAGAIVITND